MSRSLLISYPPLNQLTSRGFLHNRSDPTILVNHCRSNRTSGERKRNRTITFIAAMMPYGGTAGF